MELKKSYIDSLAPNAAAISNARALDKKFLNLFISEDGSLLFGECTGSGKNSYLCSVDFIDRATPVARCSCPSRQIPCKHSLGLMYCFASGKKFKTEAVPEDILAKRTKMEKRLVNKEKKDGEVKSKDNPEQKERQGKAKTNAAAKKIKTQIEGIGIADLMLKNLLQTGIAGIDAALIKNLEQQAKQLGNYYIGGIQTSFNEILINIKERKEEKYDNTIELILYLSALLKKSGEYLTSKEKDGIFKLDISSAIEEQIGHIWTLDELQENNMYIENAQLVQLAFYTYDDESRREFIDKSFYFCLNNNKIYLTFNYRPYKALRYVKEEDSRFELTEISKLYIYPGDINPRVRWDKYIMNTVSEECIRKIKAAAETDYSSAVKAAKNQIKNPLSNKNPVMLLRVEDVNLIRTKDGAEQLHISDKMGTKQILKDNGYADVQSVPFLKRFDKKLLIGNALAVMFISDSVSGILAAKPLAVVTDNEIVRLVY